MREILDDLDRWRDAGARIALARVVDVEPVEQVAELARLAGVVLSRQT